MPDEGVNRIEEIKARIRKFIEDRASLEVITAKGDITINFKDMKPEEDIFTFLSRTPQEIKILARTRIELDGDILAILPNKNDPQFELDENVLQIHNETVKAGIERWENYMNGVLGVLKLISNAAISNLFGKTESKPNSKSNSKPSL